MWDKLPEPLRRLFGLPPVQRWKPPLDQPWEWPLYRLAAFRLGLERTIVTIRRRLEARLHPGARYQLIGASAILAELQALHIRPVPSERTIERVLQRLGITLPRVRLARWNCWPVPGSNASKT